MSACTHQLMLVQSKLVQFSNELAALFDQNSCDFSFFFFFLSHIQTFIFTLDLCLSL